MRITSTLSLFANCYFILFFFNVHSRVVRISVVVGIHFSREVNDGPVLCVCVRTICIVFVGFLFGEKTHPVLARLTFVDLGKIKKKKKRDAR